MVATPFSNDHGGHVRLGYDFMNHESHFVIDVRNPNMFLFEKEIITLLLHGLSIKSILQLKMLTIFVNCVFFHNYNFEASLCVEVNGLYIFSMCLVLFLLCITPLHPNLID